ncbi:hypothetical protein EV662_106237, partial [Rhodovulum marinum]
GAQDHKPQPELSFPVQRKAAVNDTNAWQDF